MRNLQEEQMDSQLRITPRVDVPLYSTYGNGRALVQITLSLVAGHTYLFKDPMVMRFMGMEKLAIPFAMNPTWVLVEEMQLDVFELEKVLEHWYKRINSEGGEMMNVGQLQFMSQLQRSAGASLN